MMECTFKECEKCEKHWFNGIGIEMCDKDWDCREKEEMTPSNLCAMIHSSESD